MPTSQLLISIGVFIGVVVLIVLFTFPSEERKARRKKKKDAPEPQKDWPLIAQRLEKHTRSLKREIEKAKRDQQKILKALAVANVKNRKLQDKVSQEKEWIDREAGTLAKKDAQIHELTKGLRKAQDELEREYAAKLKLERELKATEGTVVTLRDEKRELTSRCIQVESERNNALKEARELKDLTAALQKKSDEVSWVSKTEFERLERLLHQKDKEIERISRNQSS